MSILATSTTAQVFVTTYGVGNLQGFGMGKWFDLTDYTDKEAFIEAALAYAKNELNDHDPELCFPDYEGEAFLDGELYCESYLSSLVFDIIQLDSHDFDMLKAYVKATGERLEDVERQLEEAQERFAGEFENDEDFAYQTLESLGNLDNLPPFISCHIDWSGVARDLMMDYYSANGYYFQAY